MKNIIRICLVIGLILLLSFTLQAQNIVAKLEKNRNIQAKGLVHELNATSDTLILSSDKKINYLYTVNKNYGREYDLYIDSTACKLPLNKLSKGKHVMVAVQSPKRIVFVLHILEGRSMVKTAATLPNAINAIEPLGLVATNND